MNNLAEKEFYSIVIGATVLAANAGFINVVTLTGLFSVTVSHVTGNVSKVAIALYNGDATMLSVVGSILFSFMFGSFVAGYMVGDNKFKLGRGYGYALCLESFMLFLSLTTLRRELIVGEWCASFACGLQNAICTSYSGMVVRTTHMTGICTDIGNILGQACRTDSHAELWRLKVHIPILFGFMFGGLVGEASYGIFREHSLLVPCVLTGVVGAVYLSLPFITAATVAMKQETVTGKPTVELRYIGDPRKAAAKAAAAGIRDDVYAKVVGKDVDDEMRKFSVEIGDTEIDTPASAVIGAVAVKGYQQQPVRRGTSFSAGGSVEVLYESYSSATPVNGAIPK